MQKIIRKAYANSPFDLGTLADNAYRVGVHEAVELCSEELMKDNKPKNTETKWFDSALSCAIFLAGVACALAFVCFCELAHAEEIPANKAIRAILGEDSASYQGMYAVAHGIRNRGSLAGVYGLKAVVPTPAGLLRLNPKTKRASEVISAELYQKASKAWFESETGPDVVRGASHWEGAKLKTPYWSKGFKNSVVVGGNRFYYN